MKNLLAIVCLTLTVSALAEVRAYLSESLVEENDTVELTIIVSDSGGEGAPDLSPVEGSFEVLSTSTNSQLRSINGRVESWVEYRYSLRPRTVGLLKIPALDIGGQRSPPLSLTVQPLDPAVRSAIEQMVFFESETAPDPVYVQAELILTRRFFYARGVQLYSDLPGAPELAGAVVLPVGEAQSTTTVRRGRTYGVVEQRYAVFPQRSGELVLPAVSVAASVLVTSHGRTRRRGVQVAAAERHLTVLTIPPEYPTDVPWLPARRVALEEAWDPDPPKPRVGKTLTRTIRLRAEGAIGSAIPPMTITHPDKLINSYADAPQVRDDTRKPFVTGERVQRYTILPTGSGSATLGGVRVTWWDTVAHEVRTAQLPERPFTITGTVSAPTLPIGTAASPQAGEAAPAEPQRGPLPVWRWPDLPRNSMAIVAGSAGAVLVVAFMVWMVRNRPRPGRRARLRRTYRDLSRACRGGGSPGEILAALREYLAALDPDEPPFSAMTSFREVAGNARVVDALNRAVFGATDSTGPEGDEVLAAVHRFNEGRARPRERVRWDPLPELRPGTGPT